MATVDKAFRIKNGLVVEGSSATVNGSNVLTEASTEFLQDTTGAMFTNGTYTGITFTYNDEAGTISASVSSTPTFADKIIFEGATPDDYETTLQVVDPTQDQTITLPNATDTLVGKATTDTFTNKTFNTGATGNVFQIASNSITSYTGSGAVVVLSDTPTITSPYVNTGLNINGGTTGHTQIVAASTASGVLTLPAATGTIALTSDIPSLSGYVTESGTQTLTNKTLTSPVVDGNGVVFEGATANEFETTLTVVDPTADNTITLPNVTGTVITTGDSGSVTNTMLQNSTISGVALGSNLNALTIGTGLSGTSYNGSSAVTVAIDSTVATTSGTQTLTNKTISSTSNTISVTSGNVTDFTEASVDAVAAAIAAGTQTNISITYNDEAGTLSFNASGGVSSIAGTANQITASTSTGAVTLSLPSAVTFPGTVTLNADPSQALEAATKQYVDAVAEGLHVHASVKAATTSNIDLSTDLEAGDIIDGVTLSAGDRVLVKNQSTTSQNGIYVASTSGAAVRASDYNSAAEIDPGDFFFVTGGTTYDNSGWVQTATITTLGTDPIVFEQFSGAGTYVAGNGLTLTGNSFSINTGVTVDLSTAQTLTNKTLTSPSINGPLILGNNIVIEGTDDTHETTLTFTDPTQDNTITFKDATGTVAFTTDIETAVDNFGGAVTGGTGISASYATTNNVLTVTNTDLGSAQNIFKNVVVGATTIVADQNDDTLTFSAGTGIGLSAASTSDTITIDNTGVHSITGTPDQISATASTGAVTLSLPQSIAITSSPSFASVSVGYVTLADALMGTATTSISGTSATVVDAWSVSTFKSAKYVVQMRNGDDIEVLEVLVTVDGNNNVYLTEYADVISNAQIGTTNADYSGGDVRLLVTSTNGTTVKVHRTLIEA
jgi:hypothetical protein